MVVVDEEFLETVTSCLVSLAVVLAICYLTVFNPLTHEWFHQLGFSLLGVPSVIVCYPTVFGVVYACVVPIPIPEELVFFALDCTSLAMKFPYYMCEILILSVCILFLAVFMVSIAFSRDLWWFAKASVVTFFLLLITESLLLIPFSNIETVFDVIATLIGFWQPF